MIWLNGEVKWNTQSPDQAWKWLLKKSSVNSTKWFSVCLFYHISNVCVCIRRPYHLPWLDQTRWSRCEDVRCEDACIRGALLKSRTLNTATSSSYALSLCSLFCLPPFLHYKTDYLSHLTFSAFVHARVSSVVTAYHVLGQFPENISRKTWRFLE